MNPPTIDKESSMDVKTTLREQMQAMHGTLEAAIGDCSPEAVARKLPGATINSIGAIYAHTVFSEDGILNYMIRGAAPVYMQGGWAPKIGIDMPQGGMEPDWDIKMDLPLFRQYAAAVYKATDDYLSSATDAELERVVDLGFAPAAPVSSIFGTVLAWHAATHQGEVSALKGVSGVNGLVMTH
jgi:DinB superfamily